MKSEHFCLQAPLHPLAPRGPAHGHKICLPLRGEELPLLGRGAFEPRRCPFQPYQSPLCSLCAVLCRICKCPAPRYPAGSDLPVPQTPGLLGIGLYLRARPSSSSSHESAHLCTPCTLCPSGGPASPRALAPCAKPLLWCGLPHSAASRGSLLPSTRLLNVWYMQPWSLNLRVLSLLHLLPQELCSWL